MKTALNEWLKLTDANKRNIFAETAQQKALPVSSIEKDWWVVHTLSAVFSTEYADKLVFKGGTSLSKGWNLIERFSEDVDLALDREFLGFAGDLSKKEIHKLRYASYEFISTKFVTANATDVTFTWSSGNTAIATVLPTGLVTAAGAGSTLIDGDYPKV